MVVHISTLFDRNYVIRAIVMYESARKFVPDAKFWFLCLDDESHSIICDMRLNNVSVKKVDDIRDDDLLKTKVSRSAGEFAFTAKSAWLSYIINTDIVRQNDMIIWVDADILFYSSAQSLIEEIQKTCSVAITPHKISKEKEKKVGRYNAGMIFFKKDGNSKKCLREWRNQCIDWCYHRLEDGKLGDQMYLDDWGKKYEAVCDIKHKGVNVGQWNIGNYNITKNKEGCFFVDEKPLICYHFHGLKIYFNNSNSLKAYPVTIYHSGIYEKYIQELGSAYKKIQEIEPNWQFGSVPKLSLIRLTKQKIWKILNLNKI